MRKAYGNAVDIELTSRKLLLSLRDSSVAAEDTPTRVSLVAADTTDSSCDENIYS